MTLLLQKDSEPIPGYHLEERLGKGGFGEVWRALKTDGFPVALKFILLESFPNPHELRALDVLKQIRHPNLLGTLGFRQTDAYVIQEMELADSTLQDRLNEALGKELPGIPRDELLEYMLEAAKGIDYLNAPTHRIGGREVVALQHCDIKPQNLLLVGGSVKVGDFGLVRLMETTLVTHTEGLSPMYAAPEFFASKASHYSDQYSLGITYCYLRTGQFPFAGNPRQLMYGHCVGEPNLSMLPAGEAAAVSRALAKTPEERWPSSTAFIRALIAAKAQDAGPIDPQKTAPYPATAPPDPEVLADLAPSRGIALDPNNPEWDGSSTNRIRGPVWDEAGRVQGGSLPAISKKAVETHKPGILSDLAPNVPASKKTAFLAVPAAPAPPPPAAPPPAAAPALAPPGPGAGALECARVLQGHGGAIWGVAFLQGDERLLSSSSDGTLRFWDREHAKELRRQDVRPNPIVCTAFRSDGKLALVASMDRVIRLWDLDAGRELRSLRGHASSLTTLAFAFDGIWGLSGSWDQTIRVWDLDTGGEIRCLKGHAKAVTSLALSPDGQHVLSGSADGTVRLWNVRSGQEELRCDGHNGLVAGVAYALDGKTFVSGGADGTVRLWDARKGQVVLSFVNLGGAVSCVALAADDKLVLGSGADRVIRAWDTGTGKERLKLVGHGDLVTCLVVAGDGHSLASGAKDKTIRIWELPD